jgi:hypothetical protein
VDSVNSVDSTAGVGGELLTCLGSLPPSLRLVTLFMKSEPRTVAALDVCMVFVTVVIPRKTRLVALVCLGAKAMKVAAVSALGMQHQQTNEDTPGLLPSNNIMLSESGNGNGKQDVCFNTNTNINSS